VKTILVVCGTRPEPSASPVVLELRNRCRTHAPCSAPTASTARCSTGVATNDRGWSSPVTPSGGRLPSARHKPEAPAPDGTLHPGAGASALCQRARGR